MFTVTPTQQFSAQLLHPCTYGLLLIFFSLSSILLLTIIGRYKVVGGTRLVKRQLSKEDEEFIRSVMLPYEDLPRHTLRYGCCGMRWFRSANVHAIEHYKRVAAVAPVPRSKPAA